MAEKHFTTESGERLTLSQLIQLSEALQDIKDDPEKMSIIGNYLKVWKAAKEGRLTPEGVAKFEELNKFIHALAWPVEGGAQ